MSPVCSRILVIAVFLMIACGVFYPGYTADASTTPRTGLWVANGPIYSTLQDQSTLYIGGDFTYVGPSTGSAVAINSTNGTVDSSFPKIDGTVNVVIQDGAGGWYIGGAFTSVGGISRNNLAFIQADMTVAAWNPDVSGGEVRTLLLNGTTLYVGGDFTTIDGQVRNRLAALDTTASVAGTYTTGWDPDADATVNALAFSAPSTLYIGGDFTTVDSNSRNHLAAVDLTATTAGFYTTNWNPKAGNVVNTLAQVATAVIAGGNFHSVGGQLRNHLAAFSIQVGVVTSFNPNVDDIVRALTVSGDSTILYIGGDFTTVATQTRNHLAAVDTTASSATSWDPDANDVVRELKLSPDESTLYVAGDYTSIDSQGRNRLAALDTTTSSPGSYVTPWNPDADASVRSMALSSDGSLLYAGGDFTVIGQQARSNLAALSTTSGLAIPAWIPTSNAVYAISLSSDDNILYAGGINQLAAINASDGSAVTSFNPGATVGTIETLAISDDDHMLYVGGNLTSVGGQLRNNIARYDLMVDALTAWDPGADAAVHEMVLSPDDNTVYSAGDFTSIGTDSIRTGLASIDMVPPTTSTTPVAGAYQTSQSVTLTCTDNSGTGCFETYYTIDGTIPTTASIPYSTNNPISVPVDSAVTVKYFSVDNEGSYETFQSAVYVVDTTAPTTIATPGAGSYTADNDPISLICSDAGGSGCGATYYTTDGSTPTTASTLYSGAIPLESLEGATTLKFFSVDNAGNVESVINSVNYVVDITLPVVSLSLPSATYAPPQTIALNCDDGSGSGCSEIYYTTDLSAPTDQSTKYSDTGPLTISSATVVRAIAVDLAGNFSTEVVGIYTFTIGAGESHSGTGSSDPLLLFIVLTGFVIRILRVQYFHR